jgi:ribosome maturation factor RimP
MVRGRLSAEELEERFAPELALLGYELVEVAVLRGGGRLTLRFHIDKEGGVTIEDCAAADRAVSHLLESDAGLERYVVEVSSPGIFRPLRKQSHFARHAGEIIKVTHLADDGETTQQIRGRLVEVDDDGFTVVPEEGEARRLSFEAVKKAHLDPDLAIGRSRQGGTSKGRKGKRSPKGT